MRKIQQIRAENRLTRAMLPTGANALAATDPVLAAQLRAYGMPPLWQRPQSLRTLVHIILEQKVSISSALAVMQRLDLLCPDFTPHNFLHADPEEIHAVGVSRRKVEYCRCVAQAMFSGELKLAALRSLSDSEVISHLVRIHGIGPWTAGVYLTMALCRQDAWASGDRALALSVQQAWQLSATPDWVALDAMAEAWRPWRGVAARILWHAYLSRARQKRLSGAGTAVIAPP